MTLDPLAGEPGWTPVAHPALLADQPSFLRDLPETTLALRFFATQDGHFAARARFGAGACGPPGHVHGGAQAALLDELVGGAAWLAGHPVVAATLSVKFRAMLPVGTVCTGLGEVERVSGRRVHVSGRVQGADGTVFSQAEGIFVVVPWERVEQLPPALAEAFAALRARTAARDTT